MIYFAQQEATGYIKIGYTRDIMLRLRGLKTHHGAIKLLAVIDGNRTTETEHHLQFQSIRVFADGYGNEWFHPDNSLIHYIKQHGRELRKEDESGSKTLNFAVTEEMFQEISNLAAFRRLPAAVLIREALAQYLKREGKANRETQT